MWRPNDESVVLIQGRGGFNQTGLARLSRMGQGCFFPQGFEMANLIFFLPIVDHSDGDIFTPPAMMPMLEHGGSRDGCLASTHHLRLLRSGTGVRGPITRLMAAWTTRTDRRGLDRHGRGRRPWCCFGRWWWRHAATTPRLSDQSLGMLSSPIFRTCCVDGRIRAGAGPMQAVEIRRIVVHPHTYPNHCDCLATYTTTAGGAVRSTGSVEPLLPQPEGRSTS